MSGLVQLEELVLRCRDVQARRYIAEAVACYNAGAYRACIVTTWIAVVFDIIGKLRELDMTGDAEAKAVLERFASHQENRDIDSILRFERGVLDVAKDGFELLSPLEYDDLKRLQEDRNRCAHPSMASEEDVYSPSAELARLHLRSAVSHLMARPPVQGKAAMERVLRDVRSEYFPSGIREATAYLSGGPLARPRESLVRNLIIVLLKEITRDCPRDAMKTAVQRLNGISAIRSMHMQIVDRCLTESLSSLLEQMPEDRLVFAAAIVAGITDSWSFLRDHVRTKLTQYVLAMPQEDVVPALAWSLGCENLRTQAEKRLEKVTEAEYEAVARLCRYQPADIFIRFGSKRLESSRSFAVANEAARILTRYTYYMTPSDTSRIVSAICTNDQALGAFEVASLVTKIARSQDLRQALLTTLRLYGKDEAFASAIEAADTEEEIPF